MNNRPSCAGHDLSIILTDPARIVLAIELMGTAMALGGRTVLHLRDQAVDLLMQAQPALTQAIDDGAEVTYCPTSAADRRIDTARIDRSIEAAGLVSVYARLGDARLLVV